MRVLPFIAILFILGGCAKSAIQEKPEPFATISLLVEEEIEKLQLSDKSVLKIISINGDSDTQRIESSRWKNDSNFWEKEFAVFYSFEAKPAWQRMYEIDSAEDAISKTRKYSFKDPGIPVKYIEERMKNGRIESLAMKIETEKDLYDSRRDLLFLPGRMLKVKSYRKSIVDKPQEVEYVILF